VKNYLSVGQFGQKPIHYAYSYQPPTNTGMPSGFDLDRDGRTDQPGDAFGFGKFPGQYGFVILSNLPVLSAEIRTFQYFLWKNMPDANLPTIPETGQSYYSQEALSVFRLSSKNHVDVPLQVGKEKLHLLVAHPTPPVFDGPEDRNGKRNYDEIRMLADYISGPKASAYLVDDKGRSGGMNPRESFVIMGDLNADPLDGDSYQQAILQLFNHPRINGAVTRGSFVPSSQGGVANSQNNERLNGQKGNPAHDTAFWGLRVDHVLPSLSLEVKGSGVFWPLAGEVGNEWIQQGAASDHLPVWVDLVFK
jgi:hypothetical protein